MWPFTASYSWDAGTGRACTSDSAYSPSSIGRHPHSSPASTAVHHEQDSIYSVRTYIRTHVSNMHRTTPITSVHSAAYYIYYSMLSEDTTSTVQIHTLVCLTYVRTFRLPSSSTRHFFAVASSEEGVAPDASPPHSCSSSCSSHRETTPNSQTPLMNQDSLTALQATQHALSTHQVSILLMFSACLVTCVHTVTLHEHKM